ncbi:uncharacterized protein L201_007263 [Kwoniella dendrophila CBS 6074]|uniref:Uncharacterized protein n=1 Tax=Kwoniella dendrophila CBS 6074 TaxID=1295534 RepID=A0AAX4K4I7_9TREE
MSFRSATRLTSRLAVSSRTIAGRRFASSGPAKSNDTTWMIGSAVGFGSLGAFLLLPSKAQAHDFTHSQDHAKVRAEINESAPTAKPGQEAIQNTDSLKYSPKTPDPSGIHKSADKAPNEIPAKKDESKQLPENLIENDSLKPESRSSGKNANEVARQQHSQSDSQNDGPLPDENTLSSGKKPDSTNDSKIEDDNAAGKEQGEPTQQEIKESILRAERTNIPKAAMSEEEKGHENQAEVEKEEQ